jgi:ketosteroid isomerase-like protein
VDSAVVADWIAGYVRAWETNDPVAIGDLFTDDALYRQGPSAEPWQGRDAIVANWIASDDQPGTWSFRSEVLAASGDLAFVRGWTQYVELPTDYDNLWVIRLAGDGRCREFTEWFMERNESVSA